MTVSIAGRCARSGQLGVAALMAAPGIAHLVVHIRPGVGAAATQGMINPYLAYDGFDELAARERGADQALHVVIANDPGRHLRQCAIVDAHGRSAAWTGEDTAGWAGDLAAANVAAVGNHLAGPETLKGAVEEFEDNAHLELGERLLRSLEAVDAADGGGDRRGVTSAALAVAGSPAYLLCDARVDRSAKPVEDLRGLYAGLSRDVLPRIGKLPTREDPLGQLARETSEGLG
jgi:uncharacterized Ntn-hydrolase superfamily protein